MSVKVGVRVRPFNKREEQLNCRRCIEMQDSITHLIAENGQKKSFNYDYSFWSHNMFQIDPDGIYIPVEGNKYADQKKVYEEIGSEILVNAWQGYNCCLFAYGQTGSGKSYSMLGYGANKGIIPQVCDKIFMKIADDKNPNHTYEVRVSMMEIYNQTLRDLLTSKKKTQLKICEHKKLGVYVQGLMKHSVKNYKQIEKKIQEGSNNRSMAATLMNQSSSRSHTIVSINFMQKIQVSISQTSVKYSTIHLVDLAGSQSVGKTGVDSKDRLRQAAKINQSLSTLGRVIQILADNASKAEKVFVPYRDSKLTFILRNALGGNSRTAMICAISPADDNYQQTLSTLRYAQRAKKIQNKAIVNQSDVDKLIRMLREENQMLKKMLQQSKLHKTVINQQIISNVNQMNKNMVALGVIDQDENEDDEDLLRELDFGKDCNYSELSMVMSEKNMINEKEPYITNLSEDEMLSGRVKYNCMKGLVIGTKAAQIRPDIVLTALGIQPKHAKISAEQEKIYLQICDENASEYTFLNGQNLQFNDKTELMNMDRIIFGTGCVFLVKIYEGQIREVRGFTPKLEEIDYAFAIGELNHQQLQKNSSHAIVEQQEIRRKVLEEIHQQYDKLKQDNEKMLKKKLQEQEALYSQRLKQIQQNKQKEMERMKQQLTMQAQQATKLKNQRESIMKEIDHYREIQKELEENAQDKEQLQLAKQALDEKMSKIKDLESSLLEIQQKEMQVKKQIETKEIMVKRQLQVKMVMCNNQNILNEYKLQLSKKSKNTEELKELLIRKQRLELQKQLMELVPMVQKFNLIAKQMNKNVECGLSIDYKYFSGGEVVDILKNAAYKNKLRIVIHVVNKNERRGYFWSVDVFKNRFELALSLFQIFIRSPDDPQIMNKETDPYWDPSSPILIGTAYISLQSLFYKLSYYGSINIVQKGIKIGKIKIHIYPIDSISLEDISKQTQNGIVIHNPRDLIEKSLHFVIKVENVQMNSIHTYQSILMEYELPQKSYKKTRFKSQFQSPQKFGYKSSHSLNDLSESTIFQLIDQPLALKFWGDSIIESDDELTTRDEQEVGQNLTPCKSSISSFSRDTIRSQPTLKSQSTKNKGIIVSNFDVMSKIESEYNKKKLEDEKKKSMIVQGTTKNRPKIRSKDQCAIF